MWDKPKVLFLCTGHPERSEMAEGFLRALAKDAIQPVSAAVYRLKNAAYLSSEYVQSKLRLIVTVVPSKTRDNNTCDLSRNPPQPSASRPVVDAERCNTVAEWLLQLW
jgi:protein-tyrosine-phosphatase